MPVNADIQAGGRRGPIIVVSGPPGAGKSTYARRLARDLGLEYYTTGKVFREIARRRGVTLVELNRMAEEDPSIDIEIDRATVERASRGGVVIDSHLAAWLLAGKADFMVYVKAPIHVRAERIAGRDSIEPSRALREIAEREESHWRRFLEYYGIDIRDLSVFHVIVDTGVFSIEDAYKIIYSAVERRLRSLGYSIKLRCQ